MYTVYIASGGAGNDQLSKQTVASKTINDAGRNICSLMFDEASKNDKMCLLCNVYLCHVGIIYN